MPAHAGQHAPWERDSVAWSRRIISRGSAVPSRAMLLNPFRVYSWNRDSEGHLAANGCTCRIRVKPRIRWSARFGLV